MSEMKPCPFCGNEPTVTNEFDDEVLFYGCTKDIDCPLYDAPFVNLENWNNRPIEDALTARIAELEAEQHWHVVDDGDLPIVGKSIMFYDSSSEEIYRGVYTASHHWRANYFNEKCGTVTHWMPLPTPPIVYGKVCEE